VLLSNLEALDEGQRFLDSTENRVLSLEGMLAEEALEASVLIVFAAEEVRVARRQLIQVSVECVDGVGLLKSGLHLIISYRNGWAVVPEPYR